MCYLDMACKLEVWKTLEEILFSKKEELEELRVAHTSLSKKYDSVVSSCKFVEDKFLKINQDFFKWVKTIKALKAEREEPNSTLQ